MSEKSQYPAQGAVARKRSGQAQSRLLISIPALMTVFTLGMGICCYVIFQSHSDLDEAGANALRLAIVGASFLAALSGFVLAWTIVAPLRGIETRLREIAATGRVEPISDVRHMVPEIGRLERGFDQVLTSLNTHVTQRNRYILECFTGGLILLDHSGAVMTVNQSAAAVFGPDSETLTGSNFEQWLRSIDEGAQLAQAVRAALEDGVFANSRQLDISTPDQGQLPIVVTINPIHGAEQENLGLAISFHDLSAYRQLSQQMDRADRLAAIGTFATGVAHEIRNPLGSVKGMAQMLVEETADGSSARRYAEVVVREANRLDMVVRGLLDFAHPESSPVQVVDLNQLLRESLRLSRSEADMDRPTRVEVVEDYGAIPEIRVQPDRIIQALVNLIRNAIEAAGAGGKVRLSTRETRTEGGTVASEARIANNGPAIPPKEIGHIFEPFYTSKESGTGLGLPIACQAVTTNGGQMHVESDEDETVFVVRFSAQS